LVGSYYFGAALIGQFTYRSSKYGNSTFYLCNFLGIAMIVLGISAFYHDSAAALIIDGKIVAAAQQERFSRKKHDERFPADAISYCLKQAGVKLNQVDYVGFYDKPLLTFNRLLETYLAFAPFGFGSFIKAIPVWVTEKIMQKRLIEIGLNSLELGKIDVRKILFGFHHHSHAASAFYPSPFERAAVLVIDGVGEWATTTVGVGAKEKLTLIKEIRFPHSLGLLYSAFTYYLGFAVNEGEYKVMGLAPYGDPKYVREIRENLIDIREDGSFKLNQDYFNYCIGLTMTNDRFAVLFGGERRNSAEPLTKKHMDLARSLQAVVEDVVLKVATNIYAETGEKNLCLAGGVALNCVANGRLLREGPFENIWIQPAAGDAGAALGVALDISHQVGGIPRIIDQVDSMQGSYLGPEFGKESVHTAMMARNATFRDVTNEELLYSVTEALNTDKVVGWFQGRMEFGPRALGARSIIGDARSPKMQKVLNLKIKYRESFRPFAPMVLEEDANQYFDLESKSPYMLIVAPVLESRHVTPSDAELNKTGLDKLDTIRSDIPAVTHVDYSARIQTVSSESNPLLHALLKSFKKKTGYGILVNTSFNIRDEPIVCTPDDAYRCFMGTEMDVLVIGNTILFKDEQ
jgi:carbamoyltransferase